MLVMTVVVQMTASQATGDVVATTCRSWFGTPVLRGPDESTDLNARTARALDGR